jgi:hypothetical protein
MAQELKLPIASMRSLQEKIIVFNLQLARAFYAAILAQAVFCLCLPPSQDDCSGVVVDSASEISSILVFLAMCTTRVQIPLRQAIRRTRIIGQHLFNGLHGDKSTGSGHCVFCRALCQ